MADASRATVSCHPPQERADLALFAEALATRLPGVWAVTAREHTAYTDQFPLREKLWGFGHVRWALSEFVLQRDAVLTSDSGAELVVIDRPLRRHEFLVAALEPRGINASDAVKAPDGVVVSADPARAAATVAGRLLPRYERAVHQARIEHLAVAVAAGERALAEWDAVSDSLCDDDHWPLDDRYGLRQQQRDAEMWAQFAPFLDHGPALLAHAEQTLPLLDPADRAAGRWPYRLRVLRDALADGARVQSDFQVVADALVPDHPRAKEVFDRAVAERNAEGWDCALTWTDNAGALVDMARAEQALEHSPQGPKRSAQAEAARTRSPLASRDCAAPVQESPTRPVGLQGHDRRSRSR
ncbi:hypothetical protein [Streptomyces sp. WAC01526]|uniref:hypothetical protein n=1 Tax=Streptomyces sp. WAC01526 TaxID=2588709 RepID=UPI0011DF1FFF|nr:hypothetical protein [Streptomyces sp. WAC01526]